MSEWQPIETAPRDGTAVLIWSDLWRPTCVAVTWWVLNLPTGKMIESAKSAFPKDVIQVKDGWTDGRGGRVSFEPSHWMPLPAAPN